MTTKDLYLSFQDNLYLSFQDKRVVFGDPFKGQYSNLNLNQNYQAFFTKTIQSKDNGNHNKEISNYEFSYSNNLQTRQSFTSFEASNKSFTPTNLNAYDNTTVKTEFKTSTKNSSTLSLHIAAYENVAASGDGINKNGEKSSFPKKFKNVKELFIAQSSYNHAFEVPRQQQNQIIAPEVMQFKASQRLLNVDQAVLTSNVQFPKYYGSIQGYVDSIDFENADSVIGVPCRCNRIDGVKWNHSTFINNGNGLVLVFNARTHVQLPKYYGSVQGYVDLTDFENGDSVIDVPCRCNVIDWRKYYQSTSINRYGRVPAFYARSNVQFPKFYKTVQGYVDSTDFENADSVSEVSCRSDRTRGRNWSRGTSSNISYEPVLAFDASAKPKNPLQFAPLSSRSSSMSSLVLPEHPNENDRDPDDVSMVSIKGRYFVYRVPREQEGRFRQQVQRELSPNYVTKPHEYRKVVQHLTEASRRLQESKPPPPPIIPLDDLSQQLLPPKDEYMSTYYRKTGTPGLSDYRRIGIIPPPRENDPKHDHTYCSDDDW